MSFGLTNAQATFRALMNHIIRTFLRNAVVVILADTVIIILAIRGKNAANTCETKAQLKETPTLSQAVQVCLQSNR